MLVSAGLTSFLNSELFFSFPSLFMKSWESFFLCATTKEREAQLLEFSSLLDGSVKPLAVIKLIFFPHCSLGVCGCILSPSPTFQLWGGPWKTRIPGSQRLQVEGKGLSLSFLICMGL